MSNKHPEFNELAFFQTFKPKKPKQGSTGKQPGSDIKKMMDSQKIAPDIVEKGVHFNVGKVELSVVIKDNAVEFEPVFSKYKKNEVTDAIRKAKSALKNPTFQKWLKKHALGGLEQAKNKNNKKAIMYFEEVIEFLNKNYKISYLETEDSDKSIYPENYFYA